MGIDLGGLDVVVAHQLLNRSDVIVVLQQTGSEGVAEAMTVHMLGDAGFFHCGVQLFSDAGRMQVDPPRYFWTPR